MIEFLVLSAIILVDLAYIVILMAINMPPESLKVRRLPKVSVIIAAKEGRIVGRTLRMLKKISRPKMEIIVVANDPETLKISRKYTGKVVKDKGIGKGAALNLAVRKATGSIVYFMDEDMLVGKDTISKVCSALNGNEVAVGYNLPENRRGTVTKVARLYIAMLTKMQFGIYRLIGTTFVAGRNFAIYRKTLKKVGGFRNVLTEDLDLSFRLFRSHRKVKFVNAPSRDQVPEKFSWYIRQQQRWNTGAAEAVRKWEKRLHHHDIVLFLFVVLIALIPVVSLVSLVLAIIFKSYAFLSVVAVCFLICLSSASGLGKSDVALLPLTFVLLTLLQSFAIIYSAISKPDSWYRTPKT